MARANGERTGDGGTGRARPRLPTPRAIVGGVLIATAAASVLTAHRAAAAPPRTQYVVATREVAAGQVVDAADLGTLAVTLPEGVPAIPAGSARQLIGRTAAVNLAPLGLIRPGDLVAGEPDDPDAVEVTFGLSRRRAPAGLRPGLTVSVLATDEVDGTRLLLRHVRLTRVDDTGDSLLGPGDDLRVQVAAPDDAAAAALIDAAVRSELTVVVPVRPVGPGGGDG